MARFQQGARVENIQVLRLKEEKKPLSNKKKKCIFSEKERENEAVTQLQNFFTSIFYLIRPSKDRERENAR